MIKGLYFIPIKRVSDELGLRFSWNGWRRVYHLRRDSKAC
jgi:hypothetical protein